MIIIMNITYFTGIFFLALCEMVHDFLENIEVEDFLDQSYDNRPDMFIDTFGFYSNSRKENLIIVFYFAFTSLSTVGFGDYHPRGNIERMIGAFILLGGVAIFSLIMGNFIENLQEF